MDWIGRSGKAMRSEAGAAALEFVLVAPLLLALIFGIITFGYAFALQNSLRELAAGAARATVAGLNTTERQSILQTYMAQASTEYVLLEESRISYAPTFTSGSNAALSLDVDYSLSGSIVGIASSLLGISISRLKGSAYLVY